MTLKLNVDPNVGVARFKIDASRSGHRAAPPFRVDSHAEEYRIFRSQAMHYEKEYYNLLYTRRRDMSFSRWEHLKL